METVFYVDIKENRKTGRQLCNDFSQVMLSQVLLDNLIFFIVNAKNIGLSRLYPCWFNLGLC